MDGFFPEKLLGEIFWDEPVLATDRSAFVQYRNLPRRINSLEGSNSTSMNKRMLAFLRKSWHVERNNVEESERDRNFRHMINERMRRHRHRQCCLALHSMLPHGTKMDNNSVIQTAAKEIVQLQGFREELRRKNCVIEANVERYQGGGSKVQYLRVPYPKCGIDSMVETLKYLKHQGLDTRSIKSTFSPQELFAQLEIQTHEVYHMFLSKAI
ncbi:Transcription factor bHLH92, partial [Mucuna pruriens]